MFKQKTYAILATILLIATAFSLVFASSPSFHAIGESWFDGNISISDGDIYNEGKYYSWNGSAWIEQIGPQGEPGINGTNGADGSPGANGADGLNGADAHQPINSASYVIHTFTNDTGTFYAAQNGVTGLDEWTSTNASQVINNALSVGVVHVNTGVYVLDSPPVMKSNTTLEGSGSSTILYYPSLTGAAIRVDGNIENVTVQNLVIQGAGQALSGVLGQNCKHVLVKNIIADYGYYGVIFQNNTVDATVEGCTVSRMTDDCITFTGTTSNSKIIKNYVYGYPDSPTTGSSGIEVDDGATNILVAQNVVNGTKTQGIDTHHHNGMPITSNVLITENVITNIIAYDGSGYGIVCYSDDSNHDTNIQVSNNIITGVTEGIHIRLNDYTCVQGNTVSNYTGTGIYLESGLGASIKNNVLFFGQTGSTDINVASAVVNPSICQNSISYSSSSKGIDVDASEVSIKENSIDHVGTVGALRVAGNNCTISNNKVSYSPSIGITVNGNFNEILMNTVSHNTGRGIDIQSGTGNMAIHNIMGDNSALGNLRDLGTGTLAQDNVGYSP